jgi:hypothetical protein
MKDRPGGYLHHGLEPQGTTARMATIELVDYVEAPPTPARSASPLRQRSRVARHLRCPGSARHPRFHGVPDEPEPEDTGT